MDRNKIEHILAVLLFSATIGNYPSHTLILTRTEAKFRKLANQYFSFKLRLICTSPKILYNGNSKFSLRIIITCENITKLCTYFMYK